MLYDYQNLIIIIQESMRKSW